MPSRRKKKDPFIVMPEKLKDRKIRGFSYQLEWTEDSFISEDQGGESMRLTFNFSYLKAISLFILLFVVIILGRVFYLQILKGDYYSAMARGNRIRIKSVEAQRGTIYDRNNEPLVMNVANFVLYIVPGDMPEDKKERNELIDKTSKILGDEEVKIRIDDILKEININSLEAYQPFFIIDNLDYEKALLLLLENKEMPGIILSNKNRRKYLNKFDIPFLEEVRLDDGQIVERQVLKKFKSESFSHLLGYIGKISPEELEEREGYFSIDYIGKAGLEYSYEDILKGNKGKKQIEVDALGKEKRIISEEAAMDGDSLVLSLDSKLQTKVEQILKEELNKRGLTNASAIVMNPNNGQILSLVSLPSFDNNIFSRGLSKEEYNLIFSSENKSLFNRTIKGEYPSGSTIKPVISVAALEEGVISENTKINSVGGISIGSWFFPDWLAGGHGSTDVRKAIAQSVNSFFYYIGGGYQDFQGLGLDRMLEYDKKLGLGQKTGIDLPSEGDGFLPSREWKEENFGEPWYIGDTYHLAIGQGFLLVTPLQVANFTAFFANGGTLYKPRLVEKIISNSGDSTRGLPPEVISSDFLDDYNVEVVRQGMRQTVQYGSGRSLNSLDVEVAGKTGTAQWSSEKDPHAWFTSFAPYDNPEIVVTVLVEEGEEGTYISVPITKEIIKYYFDNKVKNG
ncbi:penicillin-binding protein 2 [bacterium]|nr:penicillin-binding protein 2 [bacterium]